MTAKELIEKLKELPEDTIIHCQSEGDHDVVSVEVSEVYTESDGKVFIG